MCATPSLDVDELVPRNLEMKLCMGDAVSPGGSHHRNAISSVKYDRGMSRAAGLFNQEWFTLLKHRLLCWLLRDAEALYHGKQTSCHEVFLQDENPLEQKIWKMQLLDNDH